MAVGVKHLHSIGIVHRDIKLENVLISKRPKDKSIVPEIKIADFGLAIALGPG